MAKGDWIRVVTVDGTSHQADADKDGRRVEHRFVTRAKQVWIEMTVVTRGGRPTGMSMLIPLAIVRSITEHTTPRELTAKARRVVVKTDASD